MSRFRKIKNRPYPKRKMEDLDIEELLYLWQSWHDQRVDGTIHNITVREVFLIIKKIGCWGYYDRPTTL